ncbi:TPA: F0F1 ATP synthase subunit epsilon [Candidatus Sumerlaeota bacterium]|jgi:F-type H+-transporting ATPase subunit epsilon|nr:F0F1 ATP synthase subunit epsilon [Candidatus Sumerlaeota bacterium]
MNPDLMTLKVLLPFQVFLERQNVLRIVAESRQGSYGLLPHRLDCVLPLSPGILIYETEEEGEVYVATDEGVLVKDGMEVLVSVRNALGNAEPGKLYEAVKKQFLHLSDEERAMRQMLAKMESVVDRQLEEMFHHG